MMIVTEEQCRRMIEDARRKEREVLEQGEQLRAEIIKQAEQQRTDMLDRAEQKQTEMLEEAERQRADMLDRAEQKQTEMFEEAEQQRADMLEQAKLDANALIHRYLEQDRKEFRGVLSEDIKQVTERERETLGRTEEIHNEMCEVTNELQRSWNSSMNSSIDALKAIRDELYGTLQKWQTGLYSYEVKPIAEQYIDLYRIINVDRLIMTEIQKITDGTGLMSETNVIPTIDSLKKLDRALTSYLKKFERALTGLNLYVFYPEAGERFDEIWHVPEDDADFDYSVEHSVSSCLVPGVAKKTIDSPEDDVVVKAVVTVETFKTE